MTIREHLPKEVHAHPEFSFLLFPILYNENVLGYLMSLMLLEAWLFPIFHYYKTSCKDHWEEMSLHSWVKVFMG